ncbi:LytTR family transcriptional regulator DNA-binding domain-containing protein [uncultured Maribacter sp.]|uniref:LytR/AlgR family response regulator transcription factor n=1 Tax=uncultured Maribacter sp. TaxID=431308 RepID=UPI00260E98AB|nr:LytTR family transcriptional regulator DNA-binding domain-containing protein [uncultured Maribacter sp.]
MHYKYTIIDSNTSSNVQLQHYMEDYGDFTCVNISKNKKEGLHGILKFLPEVVIINLNKNSEEYFNMITELHQYLEKLPIFIGVAKSKEYAYHAIKNDFFDYWLQPYNEYEILKSLLKLKKTLPKQETPHTLCLKSYSDFQYLNTDNILYLRADNNATDFYMKDGTINNAYKTLKTFENQLPPNFVRIHQSYIVNTNYVSRINYGKSICALRLVKVQLPFSKSYKINVDQLKQSLSSKAISSLN